MSSNPAATVVHAPVSREAAEQEATLTKLAKSTDLFLTEIDEWHSKTLSLIEKDPSVQHSKSVVEIRHHVLRYTEAFKKGRDSAGFGYTHAIDGLASAKSFNSSTTKADRDKYMEKMKELASKGKTAAENALSEFRAVRKDLQTAIRDAHAERLAQAPNAEKPATADNDMGAYAASTADPVATNGAIAVKTENTDKSTTQTVNLEAFLPLLEEFEVALNWYVTWWVKAHMEETAQAETVAMATKNPSNLRMMAIDSKWTTLKQGYSSYKEKMDTLEDAHKTVFEIEPVNLVEQRPQKKKSWWRGLFCL